MNALLETLAYLISHPQALIYAVATALLYPVLVLEIAALTWTVWELGRFTGEAWSRRKGRMLGTLDRTASEARASLAADDPDAAVEALRTLRHGRFVSAFFDGLNGSDLQRTRLLKMLGDTESTVTRRLERTRTLVRLGPMLGLMGTLIPISPALVGLAQGDVQTLSDNLVIAFSTTVVGLLVGGLAYLMSVVRDRWYMMDVSDIEYVLEMLEP